MLLLQSFILHTYFLAFSLVFLQMTQDALCAIVLLEDISLSQAFVEFLSARKVHHFYITVLY